MTVLDDRPVLMGREEARLWTRPLRPLTVETSLGFEAIEFAEKVLRVELIPWQRWWLIHALEILPDGRYRFRTVLTLIARQQGKTFLLKIVALWMMFMGRARLVLGAAQSLDIARESWKGALDIARDNPDLADELVRVTTGSIETAMTLANGSRYRIAAATPGSGRGLSVDALILDEVREHKSWEAWGALSKTTLAKPNALTVAISNAGDEHSVVLNSLRSAALGGADDSVGLFEWSAPDGCALDDPDAWRQAMPGLGRTIDERAIRSALATDPEPVFRTELLCQTVDVLDPALDAHGWAACADRGADMAPLADRVVMCLDVAPDGRHVTLAAAAQRDDGRVLVVEVGAWNSTEDARAALPAILRGAKPRALGWYPSGPASVLGVDLDAQNADVRDGEGRRGPVGKLNVKQDEFLDYAPGVIEVAGRQVPQACQTFADLVTQRMVVHLDTPLLNSHVAGAQKLDQGDGWRFVRRGAGHVDAVYAAAGAVHLARSIPGPKPPPRSRVF